MKTIVLATKIRAGKVALRGVKRIALSFGRLVAISGACLGFSLLGAILTGCGGGGNQPSDADVTRRVLEQVVSNSLASEEAIPKLYPPFDPLATNLPWKCHMDISSSMQGFLAQKDGLLSKLLEHWNDKMPPRSVFMGEGADNTNTMTWKQIAKPETYVSLGVNYSNLFVRLMRETNYSHLFLTDGVLLENRDILPPNVIIGGLRRFLAAGGDCTLLALKVPYKGNYTSVKRLIDLPTNAPPADAVVQYETDARPLYLWVFVPPRQSIGGDEKLLGALTTLLGLQDEMDAEAAPFNLGFQVNSRFGTWECLFPPSHSLSNLRLLSEGAPENPQIRFTQPVGFVPVQQIILGHSESGATFNFELDTPIAQPKGTNAASTVIRQELNRLKVRVDAFAVKDRVAQRLGITLPQVDWTLAQTNTISQGRVKARLAVKLFRPESTTDDMFFAFNLLRTAPLDIPERWRKLSTDDDSQPDAAGQTYKLKALLEALFERVHVQATVPLKIEWQR